MRPPWRIVCDLDQRVLGLWTMCSHHDSVIVVRYLLSGALEQLSVYRWGEGPRRTSRRRGLVCRELEADKNAVVVSCVTRLASGFLLAQKLCRSRCPFWSQRRRKRT